MGVDPSAADRPTRFKPMTIALVGAGVLAAWTALLPESIRPENFTAIGAVALFAAARLGFAQSLVVLVIALGVKDVGVYLTRGFEPSPLTWLCFSVYAVLGWLLLRNTESPIRIGLTAATGGLVFFLTTNFICWLDQTLPYGYSFAGLVDCYTAAIPFYRGTFVGDLLYTGALFGLHAVLSRAFFPAERPALQAEAVR